VKRASVKVSLPAGPETSPESEVRGIVFDPFPAWPPFVSKTWRFTSASLAPFPQVSVARMTGELGASAFLLFFLAHFFLAECRFLHFFLAATAPPGPLAVALAVLPIVMAKIARIIRPIRPRFSIWKNPLIHSLAGIPSYTGEPALRD
jgi:hypothetical protein